LLPTATPAATLLARTPTAGRLAFTLWKTFGFTLFRGMTSGGRGDANSCLRPSANVMRAPAGVITLLLLTTPLIGEGTPFARSAGPGPVPVAAERDAVKWIAALRDRAVLTAEDRAEAHRALDASEETPDTLLGMALLARADGDLSRARELAQRSVDADPTSGERWAWLGTTTFEAIGASSAGAFTKAEQADAGRRAYERALELDPTCIDAHIGLAQFYLKAPALFGGSIRRARERADALMALGTPDARSYAHIILAQIAAYRSRESEMAREFALATDAVDQPHRKVIALSTCAWTWLLDRRNARAALTPIASCIELAPEVYQHWFLKARACQLLGDQREAIAAYRTALDLQPAAPTARYELARCLDQTGDPGATAAYRQFLADHPDDPRASAAKAAIRRLEARRGRADSP
jgi:tetratricopeptide (TPR) repeat protein